jgi:hemerythrin
MSLMAWSNSYSVGVATIDSQHKGLFDMVNDLHTAVMQARDSR